MALSFRSVQEAYTVFNELKKTVLPELRINSFPEDMSEWTHRERKEPPVNVVYGFDKKSDSGWENIVFFVKNPSTELKQKFDELKVRVGNTAICKPYEMNKSLWIFGWI